MPRPSSIAARSRFFAASWRWNWRKCRAAEAVGETTKGGCDVEFLDDQAGRRAGGGGGPRRSGTSAEPDDRLARRGDHGPASSVARLEHLLLRPALRDVDPARSVRPGEADAGRV